MCFISWTRTLGSTFGTWALATFTLRILFILKSGSTSLASIQNCLIPDSNKCWLWVCRMVESKCTISKPIIAPPISNRALRSLTVSYTMFLLYKNRNIAQMQLKLRFWKLLLENCAFGTQKVEVHHLKADSNRSLKSMTVSKVCCILQVPTILHNYFNLHICPFFRHVMSCHVTLSIPITECH